MNERIQELILEAGIIHYEEGGDLLETFAELIVKECMKVAVFKDSGMVATPDVAGYMAAGRSTAARMIKEHFGVEP